MTHTETTPTPAASVVADPTVAVPVTDPDQPPGLSCGGDTIGGGGFLAAARRHLRFNPSAPPAPEDLSRRVAVASANLPLQATAALYEAMGEAEITATQKLARWERRKYRGRQKWLLKGELAAEKREHRQVAGEHAVVVDEFGRDRGRNCGPTRWPTA
jgi:hypothetical protein